MVGRFRGPSDSPPDDSFSPSLLVESILGVLEEAEVPTAINDKIVRLVEAFEERIAERENAHQGGGREEALEEAARLCDETVEEATDKASFRTSQDAGRADAARAMAIRIRALKSSSVPRVRGDE